MPYCIYLRKSRADVEAENRGEEETLARHKRHLLELAGRMKLDVTQIYQEVVSGETIAARPVMQRLLADVDAGLWAGVLVMEVERLARGDTIDQGIVAQAFKFSGTKIITPMKTYDPDNEFDEEYFEFNLFMSRREYKMITRRMQRGRVASVKEGKYVGNRPPYGYRRVKLPGKGYTLEPDPEQAPVVKLVFEWYTRGVTSEDGTLTRIGVAKIVRRLNDMGVVPQKGSTWANASVHEMLENPVYIGKVRWNRRACVKRMENGQVKRERPRNPSDKWVIADGLHEPLIDKETFAAAREYQSCYRLNPVEDHRGVKNPLAGLVVCGVCGRRMVRRPYQTDKPDTLLCYSTACSNISSHLPSVETKILEALGDWLKQYRLTWQPEVQRYASMIDVKSKMLRKAEQEFDELNRQRDSLHDLLERGIYDADTFLTRSRTLAARIAESQQACESLRADIAAETKREETRRLIVPKVEHLLSVYYDLPTAKAKNDMLKEVLEKVVYTKTAKYHRTKQEETFELELYPRLPHSVAFD
jgi:site-specific DNA recombinase